jgi:hypothetical protein
LGTQYGFDSNLLFPQEDTGRRPAVSIQLLVP